MSAVMELIALPEQDTALDVFSEEKGLDPYLAKIREQIDAFSADVGTEEGRQAIRAFAYKVAQSKIALDDMGKTLVADLKDKPKKIDAERKRMRDLLDVWKEEVRAPLTKFEADEAERIQRHRHAMDWMEAQGALDAETDSATLLAAVADLEQVEIGGMWEEFSTLAESIKGAALHALTATLAKRQKHEADQAELAKLRAAAAEQARTDELARAQREATENAQRAADQQAREAQARADHAAAEADRNALALTERLAAAEREKTAAVARAKQAEIDAEARIKRAAEAQAQQQADDARRETEEKARREADKEHRGVINRTALNAFVLGGMTEACAKQALVLIIKGKIPDVSISY